MKKYFSSHDPVVPPHHPRVLVETAVTHGADRKVLLESAGLTEELLSDAEARLSYDQFETLERNALRLTNEPALGLYFGRNVHLSHLGILGLALMSSANVESAVRVGLQYYRLVAPGWDIQLRVEGDRAILGVRATISRREMDTFATEALLVGLYEVGKQIAGGRFPVREARVAFPKPAYEHLYARYFDFPVRFGSETTEVEFDAATLLRPVRGADPATATLAERHCATEASRRAPVDGLAGQIRAILLSKSAQRPTLDDVARTLQTSARSIRRNLQQMGLSYQSILDEVLRSRAEQQVRGGEVKLEQIASELGFSDVRSFRRAFKRWTGRSPLEFRENGRPR